MALGTLWYGLLAAMLAAYVCLDGFDLGAGAVLGLVARDARERSQVLRSLGPVWDGNEVWLLAAGGTLVLAFPGVYAAAFAGFYLPLTMVLWLLVFRALAVELHHHLEHHLFRPMMDLAFSASSALLAVFLGAALGNVVRGVDLGAPGGFFEPLFTDFSVRPSPGILDWYTVLVGVFALAALARHGALWLNLKTTGPVQARAARLAALLTLPTLGLVLGVSLATFAVQPLVPRSLDAKPWTWALPALALAGLLGSHRDLARGRELRALLGSALFLAGLLGCAAAGLYPTLLPVDGRGVAMTIANSAAGPYALKTALGWWIPGMALATGYFVVLYRSLPRKFDRG